MVKADNEPSIAAIASEDKYLVNKLGFIWAIANWEYKPAAIPVLSPEIKVVKAIRE